LSMQVLAKEKTLTMLNLTDTLIQL